MEWDKVGRIVMTKTRMTTAIAKMVMLMMLDIAMTMMMVTMATMMVMMVKRTMTRTTTIARLTITMVVMVMMNTRCNVLFSRLRDTKTLLQVPHAVQPAHRVKVDGASWYIAGSVA